MDESDPDPEDFLNRTDFGAAGALTSPALISHLTPTLPVEEGDGFKQVYCGLA